MNKSRAIWMALVVVVIVAGFALFHSSVWQPYDLYPLYHGEWAVGGGLSKNFTAVSQSSSCPPSRPASDAIPASEGSVAGDWDPLRMLKGSPTERFRDNLHDDYYYITTWSISGFTNQFISHVNMVYLGMLSERVPILAPFVPGYHLSNNAGALQVGQIFNLSLARQSIRQPLLEWVDVKAQLFPNSTEAPAPGDREQLGCWSTRPENNPKPYADKVITSHLRLDIAYTRAPTEARHDTKNPQDDWIKFSHMVPYIFPKLPLRKNLPVMEDSPFGHHLHPDEQLACFDYLYYATSSHQAFEWEHPWSPPWRRIGTHLHFTDELVGIVNGYLARVFKTSVDEIPPFIGVHMRRGDFDRCKHGEASDECLIPLQRFKEKVNDMQDELKKKHNGKVTQVIAMSDDTDPGFWEEVSSLGWARLDHDAEKTIEKHGDWYPTIIDQVAHSMSAGFVGTKGSTYSLLGARRVEDWTNGPTVLLHRNT